MNVQKYFSPHLAGLTNQPHTGILGQYPLEKITLKKGLKNCKNFNHCIEVHQLIFLKIQLPDVNLYLSHPAQQLIFSSGASRVTVSDNGYRFRRFRHFKSANPPPTDGSPRSPLERSF